MKHLPYVSAPKREKHSFGKNLIGMQAVSQAKLLPAPHPSLPGPDCAPQPGSMVSQSLQGRGALKYATRNLRLEEKTNRCYLNRTTFHLEKKESVLPLSFKQDSQFPQAKSKQNYHHFYRTIIYPCRKDLKKASPFITSHLRLLLSRSLPQVPLNIGHKIQIIILLQFVFYISAKG